MSAKTVVKGLLPSRVYEARRRWLLRTRTDPTASNADIFSRIYAGQEWGADSGPFFSGRGSHEPDLVAPYLAAMTAFLESLPAKPDVVDLGCGDFHIGQSLRPYCARYIGCDVVPDLIEWNATHFADLDVEFLTLDMANDDLPAGDVAILRQVLQHLSNADIAKVVPKLRNYEYVVTTEHWPERKFTPNLDLPTGLHNRSSVLSGIDLTAAPFDLAPAESREICAVRDDVLTGVVRTVVHRMR
jgi:hypothetical protein